MHPSRMRKRRSSPRDPVGPRPPHGKQHSFPRPLPSQNRQVPPGTSCPAHPEPCPVCGVTVCWRGGTHLALGVAWMIAVGAAVLDPLRIGSAVHAAPLHRLRQQPRRKAALVGSGAGDVRETVLAAAGRAAACARRLSVCLSVCLSKLSTLESCFPCAILSAPLCLEPRLRQQRSRNAGGVLDEDRSASNCCQRCCMRCPRQASAAATCMRCTGGAIARTAHQERSVHSGTHERGLLRTSRSSRGRTCGADGVQLQPPAASHRLGGQRNSSCLSGAGPGVETGGSVAPLGAELLGLSSSSWPRGAQAAVLAPASAAAAASRAACWGDRPSGSAGSTGSG